MPNAECDVMKKIDVFKLTISYSERTQTEVDTNIDFQTAGDFSRECNKKICQAL